MAQRFFILEHFYDPIRAVEEWLRVIRPGGYVFIIAPHFERIEDRYYKNRTKLSELIKRHQKPDVEFLKKYPHIHHSSWTTQDFIELCTYMKWKVVAVQDKDDKVGNGFTVVIQKEQ